MLTVSNISKTYGQVQALNKINFDVGKGELFGLIGPDGAGKTSLFRIIATLLLPDSGKVLLDGHDVVEEYEFVRKNVGYMPGRFSLYQDLSVKENLEFFATIFNTTIQENKYLIEDIFKQLEPFQNRRAGDLSGGMKQKLALSCALIHKPSMLLLDEPTTGVDAISRKEFWGMLQRLKKEGITIIVSTPYMDESKLCDRVALIQDGSIMDLDKPDSIVDRFDHTVYKVTINNQYQALKRIREMKGVHNVYPFGSSLHVYGPPDLDLKKRLSENFPDAGVQVEIIKADIEDTFMNLMTKTHG